MEINLILLKKVPFEEEKNLKMKIINREYMKEEIYILIKSV